MKLSNLTIENFRSFDHYTINNLGRINLLVGTNNSGKTSILEAAFVLMSSQPLSSIWHLLHRRGEVFLSPNRSNANVPTDLIGDLRHLFKDHTLAEGKFFEMGGRSDAGPRKMRAQAVVEEREAESVGHDNLAGSTSKALSRASTLATSTANLVITTATASDRGNGQGAEIHRANLDDQGGLSTATIDRGPIFSKNYKAKIAPTFVSTSMNSQEIARAYNDIVLTAEEDLVLEAVRLISPEIKRIAPIGVKTEWSSLPSRDGIYVRLDGVDERVPLGSMGDGIWRMLGLALAVVHSQNKILLIDDIDTGLHHSVMGEMWRFLNDCSKRFDVQIIATTHSRDCYQSLAEICRDDVVDQSEVTIQRIERGSSEAIAYSEAEIYAAAVRDVEVR